MDNKITLNSVMIQRDSIRTNRRLILERVKTVGNKPTVFEEKPPFEVAKCYNYFYNQN